MTSPGDIFRRVGVECEEEKTDLQVKQPERTLGTLARCRAIELEFLTISAGSFQRLGGEADARRKSWGLSHPAMLHSTCHVIRGLETRDLFEFTKINITQKLRRKSRRNSDSFCRREVHLFESSEWVMGSTSNTHFPATGERRRRRSDRQVYTWFGY